MLQSVYSSRLLPASDPAHSTGPWSKPARSSQAQSFSRASEENTLKRLETGLQCFNFIL